MAKSSWNGILLGAGAGALIAYASLASPTGFLSFWGNWMSSAATWLQAKTWMSWASSFTMKQMQYALSILIGALIGAYTEYK